MNPTYPVYIVSKGRWESRLTVKALERMGVPYSIVVEPQEADRYASVIDPDKILVLPFANLGQGSIPARNWIWEHAASLGAARHWVLDDNIRNFFRLHENKKRPFRTGTCFAIAEAFVDRYENIALAGFQYFTFATRKYLHPPYILNTRIYSCILIKTDLPHRWRGRYNEDTDLSIRVLKDGWCTILFYVLLADKMATMTMKGGNTEALYKLDNEDGRLLMAKSLQEQHPELVTIKRKWNRWQHVVNYQPFKHQALRRKPGVVVPQGVNEFDLQMVSAVDLAPEEVEA